MLLDYLRHIDQQTFLSIYSYVDAIPWLEQLGFYIARYGILIPLLVMVALFYWPAKDEDTRIKFKKAVVYVMLCLAVAFLADEVINLLKTRYRPFVTFPAQVAKLNVVQDLTSFPSTHTIFVFAISISLWLSSLRKIAWPLLALAILIGLSRVAVGVHYPFDIIGGAIIGVIIPIFIHHEGSWFKKKLLNNKKLL